MRLEDKSATRSNNNRLSASHECERVTVPVSVQVIFFDHERGSPEGGGRERWKAIITVTTYRRKRKPDHRAPNNAATSNAPTRWTTQLVNCFKVRSHRLTTPPLLLSFEIFTERFFLFYPFFLLLSLLRLFFPARNLVGSNVGWKDKTDTSDTYLLAYTRIYIRYR